MCPLIVFWELESMLFCWWMIEFAIGNVLLLKNNLNLSPDIAEVSQQKLLSLVAERLIDSNSNINVRSALSCHLNLSLIVYVSWKPLFIWMQNKDAGYVENQQQNISDAIDLLPCLATGIDVNIKFRRLKLLLFLFFNCLLWLFCYRHDHLDQKDKLGLQNWWLRVHSRMCNLWPSGHSTVSWLDSWSPGVLSGAYYLILLKKFSYFETLEFLFSFPNSVSFKDCLLPLFHFSYLIGLNILEGYPFIVSITYYKFISLYIQRINMKPVWCLGGRQRGLKLKVIFLTKNFVKSLIQVCITWYYVIFSGFFGNPHKVFCTRRRCWKGNYDNKDIVIKYYGQPPTLWSADGGLSVIYN